MPGWPGHAKGITEESRGRQQQGFPPRRRVHTKSSNLTSPSERKFFPDWDTGDPSFSSEPTGCVIQLTASVLGSMLITSLSVYRESALLSLLLTSLHQVLAFIEI